MSSNLPSINRIAQIPGGDCRIAGQAANRPRRAGSARRPEVFAYIPVLQFIDRNVVDAFSQKAIAALIENHTDAFKDPETAP
jgi:hypothetical protein